MVEGPNKWLVRWSRLGLKTPRVESGVGHDDGGLLVGRSGGSRPAPNRDSNEVSGRTGQTTAGRD